MILPDFRGDPEVGAKEGAAKLGNKLFTGVTGIPPFHPPHVAGKALVVLRPVGELMRQRGGVALSVAERLEGRHLHIVRAFGIKGAGAAVADIGTGRGKEPVGGLDALQRGEGRGLGLRGVMRGQVLALLGIEHGVTLQEGDFALALLALRVRLGLGDAVGINHELAGLALLDVAAKLKGLLEGQP